MKWTHVDRSARNRKGRFHVVDPHYNGNGIPAYWSCHVCGLEILLNKQKVPIATPVKKVLSKSEAKMSSQP